MTDTEKRMAMLVREHFGIDLAEKPNGIATSMSDLNVDSLDIIELTMAIEEEWAITIHDDEMEAFGPDLPQSKTVADLVALVEGKLSNSKAKEQTNV